MPTPCKSPRARHTPAGVRIFVCALAIVLACATPGLAQRPLIEPEQATGRTDGAVSHATRHMITTANRLASEAGREILRAGGSAVDAAIAAQLVLGLVEPQSSGLGGGAFLLHWDKSRGTLAAFDGRETAPATAKPDRFMKDGAPMPFMTVVKSGLSVGTPGLIRMLWDAHRTHGKLAWADLFDPAIRLAEDGFKVSPRLNLLLRWTGPESFDATARAYFFGGGGAARAMGSTLKNPAYAATLRAIAANGADAFYGGPIAADIVRAVTSASRAAGDLSMQDLARYRTERREALCTPYRTHKICGMGPPSSGGIAIAQILGMVERFDLGTTPDAAMNGAALHLIVEAEKLAYADRNLYLADPAFVPVPPGLTDPAYLASRRALIDATRAMERPEAGQPPGVERRAHGDDATLERAGTSHISVIDGDGNAVSMTTTIEGVFGSGLMAGGFLLNNELTDFSFQPADSAGRPIANRVEPGKRPRSTMAPTLVFDANGQLALALGSPGGGRIIYFVTKALVALLDWKLDAYQAAALMNFGSMGGAVDLELDWSTVLAGLRLKSYGHNVNADLMTSGLNILAVRDGRIEGGSDPRREGAALGD